MAKKDKKINQDGVFEEEKTPVKVKEKNSLRKLFWWFVFLLLVGSAGYFGLKQKWQEYNQGEATVSLQSAYEQKLNAVYSRLQAQEAEISALKENLNINKNGVSEAEVTEKLAVLKQNLKSELLAEISTLAENGEKQVVVSPESQTKEVLLANAAIIIRDLALKGEAIEYELEVLNILAQGSYPAMKYVENMQKYEKSGIAGKSQLIRNFNKIYAEFDRTELKNNVEETQKAAETDDKWYKTAWDWFKKLFVAEKKIERPVFNYKEDEIWNLVNDGNIAEALNELALSEKYAALNSTPLETWKIQARNYLDFEQAVEGLLLNALASLHLKELER